MSRRQLGLPASVVVVAIVLIVIIWVTVRSQTQVEREQAMLVANERTPNLAVAFEQSTIRTLETADSITRYVDREFARDGWAMDLEALTRDAGVNREAFDAIGLVDASGDVVKSVSATRLEAPINIADREHFMVHREPGRAALFIGKPVLSRRSNEMMVPVTRRLETADGRFAGVVSVQFRPERFIQFYENATLHPRDVLSLIGRDGITRARQVGDKNSTGENISGSQLFRELATRDAGVYIGPGRLDGVERLYAFRAVPGYPLVATVGVARADNPQDANGPAAVYRLDQADRLADPYQVARPVGGQQGRGVVEHLAHRLMPLPDRQAAEGVAVEAGLDQPVGGFAAQGLERRALLDPEQGLGLSLAEGGLGPRAPAGRQLHALARARLLGRPGDAFVQLHDDVAAEQVGLDLHRAFGRQHMLAAVQMAGEGDGLFRDLADAAQAHDLEAAAVGEDRPVPAHEAVEAAQPLHPLGRRPQHQVVGVAQNDVGPGLDDLINRQGLDRAGRADGHEGRRADVAARSLQDAGARCAVGGCQFKGESRQSLSRLPGEGRDPDETRQLQHVNLDPGLRRGCGTSQARHSRLLSP